MKNETLKEPGNGKRGTSQKLKADPKFRSDIDDLRRLLMEHENRAWAIGDFILKIVAWALDNFGIKPTWKSLAEDLALPKVKGNFLNRLALTAQKFHPEIRSLHPDWTWFDFDELRRAQDRLTKAKKPTAKDRTAMEEEIMELLKTKPKNVREFSNRLADRREEKNRETIKVEVAERRKRLEGVAEVVDRCHHADWQSVIRRVADGALDGMVADPPFPRMGSYYSTRKSFYESTRCVGNECDNASPTEAISTTLPIFDYAQKFQPHGFILLFQEGGYPLDRRILARAKRRGWSVYRELHLIKVDDESSIEAVQERQVIAPAPSLMDEPFAPVEIKAVLFYREGYKPKRIGTRSNQNAFFFRSTSRRAVAEVKRGDAEPGYRHHFECPPEVLDALLTRLLHTDTKQLVFEPFGCTAPACVSAIRNGWDWVYSESNPRNFERGLQRIEAALQTKGQSLLLPTKKSKVNADGGVEGEAA